MKKQYLAHISLSFELEATSKEAALERAMEDCVEWLRTVDSISSDRIDIESV